MSRIKRLINRKRNIGKEILSGLRDIKRYQKRKKRIIGGKDFGI